jgi:hypothetical protein
VLSPHGYKGIDSEEEERWSTIQASQPTTIFLLVLCGTSSSADTGGLIINKNYDASIPPGRIAWKLYNSIFMVPRNQVESNFYANPKAKN